MANKKVTQEEFEKRAHIVHGDKYIYGKYDTFNTKMQICCRIHGNFFQTPNNHLKGRGCPICGKIITSDKIKMTQGEFEYKSNIIHKGKYEYGVYEGALKKMIIICPLHGEFLQIPNKHLQGQGCPQCSIENRRMGLIDFKNLSENLHNNRYDYSNVDYSNNNTKVCIICPDHGEFWQTPAKHLFGQGCPKCKGSHLENEIRNFLTENNIRFKEQYKTQWLGLQSLDFYLPDYKVGIECQGSQHFKVSDLFGEKEHLKTIERDNCKLKKCKENGIRLLYYSNLGINYPYEVFEDKELLLEKLNKPHPN